MDTGEKWNVLPFEYPLAEDAVELGDLNIGDIGWEKQERRTSMIFFFPPFKSRHFSLTHEISPLPEREKTNTGYGGLLGFVAKLAVSGDGTLVDWNFPEVRIR